MKIKIFIFFLIFLILNFFYLRDFFSVFYALHIEKDNTKKIKILEKKSNFQAQIDLAKILCQEKKEYDNSLKILENLKQNNYLKNNLIAENYYRKAELIKIDKKNLSEKQIKNLDKKINFLENSLDFYRKSLKQKYFLETEKNILFIEKKLEDLKNLRKKLNQTKQEKNSGKNNSKALGKKQSNKKNQNNSLQKNWNNKKNKEKEKKLENFLQNYSKALEKSQENLKKYYNKNYSPETKGIEDFFWEDAFEQKTKKDW